MVAGPQSDDIWAARNELRVELDQLLKTLKPTRPATLVNIWAYYGAGKTYALRYLEKEAVARGITAIYCVTPKGATGFVDLYRSIVSSISDNAFMLIQEALKRSRTDVGQSIYQALRARNIGSQFQAANAYAYICAQKISSSSRRDLSATADLTHPALAAEALTLMLKALAQNSGVILLIDEAQDLSGMRDRALNETVGLIQKVFDELQYGVRIIASFTTGVKDTIRQVLGDALYHRASKLIEIPEFSEDDALNFLKELITPACCSSDANVFSPFTDNDVLKWISSIKNSQGKLVPRELIRFADDKYQLLDD